MNYKNRKIIEIAQAFGYTTAKGFAIFLKLYNPQIKVNTKGKELMYLPLI